MQLQGLRQTRGIGWQIIMKMAKPWQQKNHANSKNVRGSEHAALLLVFSCHGFASVGW